MYVVYSELLVLYVVHRCFFPLKALVDGTSRPYSYNPACSLRYLDDACVLQEICHHHELMPCGG